MKLFYTFFIFTFKKPAKRKAYSDERESWSSVSSEGEAVC